MALSLLTVGKPLLGFVETQTEILRQNAELTLEQISKIEISESPTPAAQGCIQRCQDIYRDRWNRLDFRLEYPEKLPERAMDLYRYWLVAGIRAGHLQAMINFVLTTYDNTQGLDLKILAVKACGVPTQEQLAGLAAESTCRLYLEDPEVTHSLLEKIASSQKSWGDLNGTDLTTVLWLLARNYDEGRKCLPSARKAWHYAVKAHKRGCSQATEWLLKKNPRPRHVPASLPQSLNPQEPLFKKDVETFIPALCHNAARRSRRIPATTSLPSFDLKDFYDEML